MFCLDLGLPAAAFLVGAARQRTSLADCDPFASAMVPAIRSPGPRFATNCNAMGANCEGSGRRLRAYPERCRRGSPDRGTEGFVGVRSET